MQVTYYLEVTSSWCFWAEPVWADLKRRYAGRVAFDWKIAKMNPADFPTSHRQYDWFLRRSAAITGADFVPSSAYYDVPAPGAYPAASAVAEGARSLGVAGDEVRCALSDAAYRNGRKIGHLEVAIEIAVAAANGRLDPLPLRERALSADVAARLDATTAEFHALRVTQRPTFVLENSIGDKAVFSGVIRAEPLVAAMDAMLADAAAYAAYRESFGVPPP
jgi:predicted DsbA family dithiol-disulfide isomerase